MLALLSKSPFEFFLDLDLEDLNDWAAAVVDARETLYPPDQNGGK